MQRSESRAQYKHSAALSQIGHKADAVKNHQELVNKFAACLLKENENASTIENPLWMRQLLLPHLEQFHQVGTSMHVTCL